MSSIAVDFQTYKMFWLAQKACESFLSYQEGMNAGPSGGFGNPSPIPYNSEFEQWVRLVKGAK